MFYKVVAVAFVFHPMQTAQQTRPTATSIARRNKKCWTHLGRGLPLGTMSFAK